MSTEYKPPRRVHCEHRDCERGQRHNGCHHYHEHDESERLYCGTRCPKNGAICVPVEEEREDAN